jgi:hypothetical protein
VHLSRIVIPDGLGDVIGGLGQAGEGLTPIVNKRTPLTFTCSRCRHELARHPLFSPRLTSTLLGNRLVCATLTKQPRAPYVLFLEQRDIVLCSLIEG